MDQPPLDALAVALIEVLRAEILVDAALGEQMVDDGQDRVADRHCRLLLPPARGQAAELRTQVGPLAAARRLGRLHQGGPECPVPLARLAALALARALLVAGAHPGPRGQVPR